MEESTNQTIRKEDVSRDENIEELYRRGRARKYFQGAGDFRSGEGFGYMVGGALCVFMGAWIFPMIFGGHTIAGTEKYLFWAMTAVGIYLTVKGIFVMRKEDKSPRTPITDEQFDEIFHHDLKIAKAASVMELRGIASLSPDHRLIHMYGPNYYTPNRHLPLLWKVGSDGKIRYSNFVFVTIAFEGENVYAHNCIFNCRNGELSLSHTFQYERDQLTKVVIEEKSVERLTAQGKIEEKDVTIIIVGIMGKEDINELSVILRDHTILNKMGGWFDEKENREAVLELMAEIDKNDTNKRTLRQIEG